MIYTRKIAIVHYRAGRTDGVSLEIEKRKAILESLGMAVKIISGPLHSGSDLVIPELEFDTAEIREIKENSFAYFASQTMTESQLMKKIHAVSRKIESQFMEYHQQEKFDGLLIHNVFSHGRHIAAASAFTSIARRTGIPVISTNHDYFWERVEYQHPAYEAVQHYLDEYVPPALESITHVCINSLARDDLQRKKGIAGIVFPDIFDFQQPRWKRDDYNSDFLETIGVKENDLIVLQATRIVQRKGIELAVAFVDALRQKLPELHGKQLYNGKRISEESEVVLILAGYAEESAQPYLQKLEQLIQKTGITARFIDQKIAARRSYHHLKKYSLWDSYVYADLVSYPSLFEGWGNQFIEAVFAEKPVLVFEYPVFQTDIRGEGYHYISLGDTVMPAGENALVQLEAHRITQVVTATMQVLTSMQTNDQLRENFNIGEKYHGYHVLQGFLEKQLHLPVH